MSLIQQNKSNLIQQLDRYSGSEVEERDLWMGVRDAIDENGIGGGDDPLRVIREIRKVETLLETTDVTGIVYPDKKYAEIFWTANQDADIYKVLRVESDTEPQGIDAFEVVEETDRTTMVDFKIKTKTRYWYQVSAYKVETVIVYEDSTEFQIDKPYDAFEY